MPIFHAIAAMSENRVIGNQGKIPWHIPEDFRWFKQVTMGGTLIMGRKTFESIGRPLPGRTTVVLTHGQGRPVSTEIYTDAGKLENALARCPKPDWICGGEEIYRRFVPVSQAIYLTVVKRQAEGDAFFPSFEESFNLQKILHENDECRVEYWLNNKIEDRAHYPAKDWPF